MNAKATKKAPAKKAAKSAKKSKPAAEKKSAGEKKPRAKNEPKPKKPSALDAAAKVLGEAGAPQPSTVMDQVVGVNDLSG